MSNDKSELRNKLKESRLRLRDGERTSKSWQIVDRLKSEIDWSGVKTVHYFEPIRELLEVDVSDLVTDLEDKYPDIQLITPKLINGEWEMISIKDQSANPDFDVILVPMLGFDPDLQRIGYGGGYYDKFLKNHPQARKIGVCFEEGKVAHIPVEAHDVALDMIVTEDQVYQR